MLFSHLLVKIINSNPVTTIITNPAAPHFETWQQNANTFEMVLHGDAGRVYAIQTSTNLINWSGWTTITNHAGKTQIIDPSPAIIGSRYYRAQLVP